LSKKFYGQAFLLAILNANMILFENMYFLKHTRKSRKGQLSSPTIM